MATGIITTNAPKDLGISATAGPNVTIRGFEVSRSGPVVDMRLYFDVSANLSNNAVIVTLSETPPLPIGPYAVAATCALNGSDAMVQLERVHPNVIGAWGPVTAGTYYFAQFVYLTNDA